MRILSTCVAAASLFVILGACKKQDDSAAPSTVPSAAYSAYPQQPPYPQQAYPPATAPSPYPQAAQPMPTAAPQPVPTAVAPAGGAMAVPGPVAFQCQNDVPCGTHHCNVQYGKCAFPCQTNVDCITPNSCIMGLCVPAPPQAH